MTCGELKIVLINAILCFSPPDNFLDVDIDDFVKNFEFKLI